MQLRKLVKNIHYTGNPDDREISAISYDSRKVKPGTLFVAIAGMQTDGYQFTGALYTGSFAALLPKKLRI